MSDLAACGSSLAWHGCYQVEADLCTPESYAHPAKGGWGLAFRIVEHLEELGLLRPGDTVLDSMAGTGRFLLAAAAKGYKTVAVELEPKFVSFLEANKTYAEKKLGHPIDMAIIQGDSRHLSELLRERGLVQVVSPPYEDSLQKGRSRNDKLVFGNARYNRKDKVTESYINYGQAPGQIGNMKG